MQNSFLDRRRAEQLLREARCDALVISEPEAFQYITGVSQGVAGLFRRAGGGFALVPADPSLPIGAVIGDLYEADFRGAAPHIELRTHPLWIETVAISSAAENIEASIAAAWAAGRPKGFARPATFSLERALDELADLLRTLGLAGGRLGLDLDFVPTRDFAVMRERLAPASLIDGAEAFARLRMVKAPGEIERLRLGAQLGEAGLRELSCRAAAEQTSEDLRAAFRAGVAAEAGRRGMATPPSWEYISVGPEPWRPGGRLQQGAIVKADVGCVIDGYSSDTSRNYVFGEATPEQAQFHGILEEAFEIGLAAIGPGRPVAGVHRAVTRALETAGLSGFSRGHFGHGLGQSLFSEKWPFISADVTVDFEPGMVIAFEVPIYVTGVGGFNIEDQLLVTETGIERMNTLPRGLMTIGGRR